MNRSVYTPKEFSDAAYDGLHSAKWVRAECRRFLRTKGREGIAVISRKRPYLIPASEVTRVRAPLVFTRALRCA